MLSSGHCTKRWLRSPPLAVTLNFWPFGLSRPCATACRICEAASSCVTSVMIGITRLCAIHAVAMAEATKCGR